MNIKAIAIAALREKERRFRRMLRSSNKEAARVFMLPGTRTGRLTCRDGTIQHMEPRW